MHEPHPALRAFRMHLRPGVVDEYIRRHDEIWPGLEHAIRRIGTRDYLIHLDQDGITLFAVVTETGEGLGSLSRDPVMLKWWSHMANIMVVAGNAGPYVSRRTRLPSALAS